MSHDRIARFVRTLRKPLTQGAVTFTVLAMITKLILVGMRTRVAA